MLNLYYEYIICLKKKWFLLKNSVCAITHAVTEFDNNTLFNNTLFFSLPGNQQQSRSKSGRISAYSLSESIHGKPQIWNNEF